MLSDSAAEIARHGTYDTRYQNADRGKHHDENLYISFAITEFIDDDYIPM